MEFLRPFLKDLRERGLLRKLTTADAEGGRYVVIDGRRCLSFATNDYLDLAAHPQVREAAARAAEDHGVGARASRLTAGTSTLHTTLESALAAFTGYEAALLFPTGYQANIGVLSALLTRSDTVFSDKLNHASIIDGCRLSGATKQIYDTRDAEYLGHLLESHVGAGKRLVVTESVFSMDGTIAPVDRISKIARQHDAVLMLDDAHGIGVLGSNGRGVLEHFGLPAGTADIYVGTLSKALGSMGGFVAGGGDLIRYLVNRSRSFIYATGLSPACCAGALAALEILQREPERVSRLREISQYTRQSLLQAGLDVGGDETAIVPVILGDNRTTMDAATQLLADGIFAPGIRPPTVPEGRGRIRVSLSSAHTREDVDRLVESLKRTLLRSEC